MGRAELPAWPAFLLRRRVLLTMRDNPGLLVFALLLAGAIPALSVRGAEQAANLVQGLSAAPATSQLYFYLGSFLFWQTFLLSVGALYLAKVWRRPAHYLFLPFEYARYAGMCLKRVVAISVLVTMVLYLPLYQAMGHALGMPFGPAGWLDVLVYACLAATLGGVFFLILLRVVHLSWRQGTKRWPIVAGLGSIAAGVVFVTQINTVHSAIRSSMLHIGQGQQSINWIVGCALALFAALGLLKWLAATQPEYPLARAAKASRRQSRRYPVLTSLRLADRWGRAVVPFLLILRQRDVHGLSLGVTAVVIGMSIAMRFADNNTVPILQAVVTSVIPYAGVLYSLKTRSTFFGLNADGLTCMPLRMRSFAPYMLLCSVMWPAVITATLAIAAAFSADVPLPADALAGFVMSAVTLATIAHVIGSVFRKDTLGNQITATGFLFGTGIILQVGLQQASQYRFGLQAVTAAVCVLAAVTVVYIEQARRSRYEST